MKIILSFIFLSLSLSILSQTTEEQNDVRLFAQCMFSITDQTEMDRLQNDMYLNPYIEMVRLDMRTQRALVITTGLSKLSADEFRSWFEEYESTVSCIQIGIYGVDQMDSYPFKNCQN